jgi:hypothetical protein
VQRKLAQASTAMVQQLLQNVVVSAARNRRAQHSLRFAEAPSAEERARGGNDVQRHRSLGRRAWGLCSSETLANGKHRADDRLLIEANSKMSFKIQIKKGSLSYSLHHSRELRRSLLIRERDGFLSCTT